MRSLEVRLKRLEGVRTPLSDLTDAQLSARILAAFEACVEAVGADDPQLAPMFRMIEPAGAWSDVRAILMDSAES